MISGSSGSPEVPLPSYSDAGTGCMVLGVVPGVGPMGLGSGGGSPHFLLLVVTFNSPPFISRFTVCKQARNRVGPLAPCIKGKG